MHNKFREKRIADLLGRAEETAQHPIIRSMSLLSDLLALNTMALRTFSDDDLEKLRNPKFAQAMDMLHELAQHVDDQIHEVKPLGEFPK